MAKLTLSDLTSLANQTSAINTLNLNWDAIIAAIENTLSLDGTSPNAMEADLDMNSNRILNLPDPVADTEPARKAYVDTLYEELTTGLAALESSVEDAEAAQAAAEVAQGFAEAAQLAAETAETNAETAETNAETAETNAEAAQAAAEAARDLAIANSQNSGLYYIFDDATSASGIAAGQWRANNADLSAATELYFHDEDASGNDMEAELLSWDDVSSSTIRAKIFITRFSDGSAFIFDITGASTDGSGVVTLSGAYSGGVTSFTDADGTNVLPALSGPAGSGAASSISYDNTSSGLTADDAQEAIDEVEGRLDTAEGTLSGLGTMATEDAGDYYTQAAADAAFEPIDATILKEADIASTGNVHSGAADKLLAADNIEDALAYVALTDAATIAVDMDTGINFSVTLTDNRTLGNPTNPPVGRSGVIRITQDGGGGNTLAYGANWEFIGGQAPVLSAGGGDVDYLSYYVNSATSIIAWLHRDVS